MNEPEPTLDWRNRAKDGLRFYIDYIFVPRSRANFQTSGFRRSRSLTWKSLDYTVRERVAEITMKRGPVNAIDHGLIEDINIAYCVAKADPGVRAVILTSAFENSFSAGMDLATIRGKRWQAKIPSDRW